MILQHQPTGNKKTKHGAIVKTEAERGRGGGRVTVNENPTKKATSILVQTVNYPVHCRVSVSVALDKTNDAKGEGVAQRTSTVRTRGACSPPEQHAKGGETVKRGRGNKKERTKQNRFHATLLRVVRCVGSSVAVLPPRKNTVKILGTHTPHPFRSTCPPPPDASRTPPTYNVYVHYLLLHFYAQTYVTCCALRLQQI